MSSHSINTGADCLSTRMLPSESGQAKFTGLVSTMHTRLGSKSLEDRKAEKENHFYFCDSFVFVFSPKQSIAAVVFEFYVVVVAYLIL